MQLAFLRRLQRLLTEGVFTSSYEFAVNRPWPTWPCPGGDESGAALTLTTTEIAEAMVALYWRQVVPSMRPDGGARELRQNTKGEAAIRAQVRRVQSLTGADGAAAPASGPSDAH